MNIKDNFLKYVSIDTQSDPASNTVPSTKKQYNLAFLLVEQLKELGLEDAKVDEFGIVYASLDANDNTKSSIGFIAHMDTAPDASGKNVKPQFIEDYSGGKILLNKQQQIYLDPDIFPAMNEVLHHDLITTDGTTLLGADDKAGIAIIMDMLKKLITSDILHGGIKIAFTPDEEVGNGANHFNVKSFGASIAYTIDGGSIHEIGYENFNAFGAKVEIHGRSVHPGDAKNKMINAINVGIEFDSMLPANERPQHTEEYEGFYHLHGIEGACQEATLNYIIRNHDLNLAKKQIKVMENVTHYLNNKYEYEVCKLSYTEQYLNMYEVLKNDMECVNKVLNAYNTLGIDVKPVPIRGGTDGARLTFEGLPCPNISTGGYNFHGHFEFVSLTSMKQVVQILLEIIKQ